MYINRCLLLHPVLSSFPINMVQSINCNESLGINCKILNKKYLEEYELKDFITIKINTFKVHPNYLIFIKENKKIWNIKNRLF